MSKKPDNGEATLTKGVIVLVVIIALIFWVHIQINRCSETYQKWCQAKMLKFTPTEGVIFCTAASVRF